MTALSTLPPEVLLQIVDHCPSKAITLWLSGDVQVRRSLTRMRNITIIDKITSSTSRWPSFLGGMDHLKELHICRCSGPIGWAKLVSDLSKLRCLKSLKLDIASQDLKSLLHGLPAPLETLFPELETLHLLCSYPFFLPETTQMKLPKTLTELETSVVDPLTDAPISLRTLKYRITDDYTLDSSQTPFQFPTTLTTLHTFLRLSWQSPSSLRDLVSLSELDLQVWGYDSPEAIASSLPSRITNLTLRCHLALNHPHGMMPDLSTRLPSLRKFSFLQIASTVWIPCVWQPLPPSLEELTLKIPLVGTTLILPPNLKILDISYSLVRNTSFLHHPDRQVLIEGFPPTLTTFYCSRRHSQDFQTFVQKSLDFTNIEHLSLPNISYTEHIMDRISIGTLKSLEIMSWRSLPAGQTVFHSLLYSSLTSLKITATAYNFDELDMLSLPRGIQHLDLTHNSPLKFQKFWGPHVLESLPEGFITLNLRSTYPIFETLDLQALQALGRLVKLESAVLHFDKINIENTDLQQMPTSLRHLALYSTVPWPLSSECFAYFPRYLKTLILPVIRDFDSYDLIFLPHTLHDFIIQYYAWQGHEVQYAPPSLQSFIVSRVDNSTLRAAHAPAYWESIDPRTPTQSFFSHNNLLTSEWDTPRRYKDAHPKPGWTSKVIGHLSNMTKGFKGFFSYKTDAPS